MFAECLVIFGLIFAVDAVFFFTNRKYVAVVLPLLVVPFVNVISELICFYLNGAFDVTPFPVHAAINIVAAIISCIMIVVFSSKFKNKSSKFYYLLMCIIFNVSLSSILIYNLYSKLYL